LINDIKEETTSNQHFRQNNQTLLGTNSTFVQEASFSPINCFKKDLKIVVGFYFQNISVHIFSE